MNAFRYRRNTLYAENVAVRDIAAKAGTPLYIYSKGHFSGQFSALAGAMAKVRPLICYSVKANSNAAVIKTFLDEGAGVDIVSGGELARVLNAGAVPSRIVFAGVGKTTDEIEYAIRENILFFTVESEPEAMRISACARKLGKKARIAFRVNPDVDPSTHKYIATGRKENKFGLDIERVIKASEWGAKLPNIEIAGLHMHVGSQVLSVQPFLQALEKVKSICAYFQSRFKTFRYLDIGGGIGIRYRQDQPELSPELYAKTLVPLIKETGLSVVMEPGRFLVGNGGILVCCVQYIKESTSKKFIIVDAGMNDLLRPSLYDAHHEVLAVEETGDILHGDLVGPVCESGDFIAKDRNLPAAKEGDLLAIQSAGAYGFSMSSNYNSRPRAAEVMVDGDKWFIIRQRETLKDLIAGEVGTGKRPVAKKKSGRK